MSYDYTGDEEWVLNDSFISPFPKPGKLLEVGCGTGQNIIPFARLGYDVTGLELVERRVELCKFNCNKYKVKAKIMLGDAREKNFREKSFDYVNNWGIIEHFPESLECLNECYRVLKHDGLMALQVPNKLSFFTVISFFERLSDKLFGTSFWTIGYEKPFTLWELKKQVKLAGFEIINIKLKQATTGRKFPMIHTINRMIDKPLFWLGFGGRSIELLCLAKKPFV